MNWLATTLDRLAAQPVIGYSPAQYAATEPTALAALALIARGKTSSASPALDFLVSCQGSDGAVGIRENEPSPGWPTSLAVMAWQAADAANGRNDYRPHARRGIDWILDARGVGYPLNADLGHDTRLVAWSWADQTHSWVEPTAMHALALKMAGLGTHARVREAIRMLLDRLLPGGGCNYGNTSVMGQTLLPHVQPTGLAMLALAGEGPESIVRSLLSSSGNNERNATVGSQDFAKRIQHSLAYLRRSLAPPITASSLAWGLLGLRAHAAPMPAAKELLTASYDRVQTHDRSLYKLSLLALAAQEAAISVFVRGGR